MSNIDRFIEIFKDKKILILGFGREGKSSYSFLKRLNFGNIDISDGNKIDPPNDFNGELFSGESYQEVINNYDIVLKSPGVKLDKKFHNSQNISSQVDIFLSVFKKQVIGATGTKGKSTTSSMIYHVLSNITGNSILAGNIGVPVFDIIDKIDDKTHIVLELSCHQLQFIKNNPHISIITNIYPEHLDYYENLEAYKQTKFNIYKYQSDEDYIIFPKGFVTEKTESFKIEYDLIKVKRQYLVSNSFENFDMKGNLLSIFGEHNYYNAANCLLAVRVLGYDTKEASKYLNSFKGLEHRLEYVGCYSGIHFVNDSISTIPETSIMAIKSFSGKVDTIILGGMIRDENVDYSELCRTMKDEKVKKIIFLPESGKLIVKYLLQDLFKVDIYNAKNLDDAIYIAFKETRKGKYCLLSPAAASYNTFKNFEERGRIFKELVSSWENRIIL
ncbi:MAG: UDP-N-acetylmuramoyl-L-alanine--D-glutamate ligase [Candidatus Delongbacteria bacterium]|nr:UDP-N-acetylmuramoyl-L-alanine--D-glutamate ligase [Candidatus Delongbacteria bacterium]MBN2833674.1 UDP-N-acetylmuramoyl-L-alanine--D-glutamate ligase [Candidatus Delongbacteria bacterium]